MLTPIMATEAFNASAVLDWWLIDERSVRQQPLRAVGDAISHFASVSLDPKMSPRHYERSGAENLSYNCKKLADTIRDAVQYSFPLEQQFAISVHEINRVTNFYRRLAEGKLPELAQLPADQCSVSSVPLVMSEQTMAALTLLAYSLLKIRSDFSGISPPEASDSPELNIVGGVVTPRSPNWGSVKPKLKLVS